jgi:acyl carrier protein
MGLDSVEILMKVEETFGISIPDEEAQKIVTIGDFHNAVWRHLNGKQSNTCKTQHLFYTLRKSIADEFGYSPQQLTLAVSPETIFPKVNRRDAYATFADRVHLKLPPLVLTDAWQKLLVSVAIVTVVGGFAVATVLMTIFDYGKWTLLIPVMGIVLTSLLSKLIEPKRIIIEDSTVRDFINRVLAINYATMVTDEGTNRREMEMVINQVIADMAGLPIDEITPDKRIGNDLGID